MRKRVMGGRTFAGILVFILVMAIIIGGTAIFERRQQGERQRELEAQRERTRDDLWTEENTVYLDGNRYGFDHRLETFLFVGTDNSGSGSDDPQDYRGPMADFLLLMVIDHTDNTIGYIQIDRNTMTDVVELDYQGNFMASRKLQICTAHWYGHSPEMCAEITVNAVRNFLGGLGGIDGYYIINMDDIGRLNHTVGGVEVTIEDDLDATDAALTRGATLVLDDEQAERFLRARMNVGMGQNAERMARQRQYMDALFDKVRQRTLEDPRFGLEMWDMLKSVAVTNMNGSDFSRIAQKLIKGENKGIHTIKGETVIGQTLADGQEHEEFYADADSIRDEMIDMFSLTVIPDDLDLDDDDIESDEDDEEFDEDDEDLYDDLDEDDEDLDEDDDDDGEYIDIDGYDEDDEEDDVYIPLDEDDLEDEKYDSNGDEA